MKDNNKNAPGVQDTSASRAPAFVSLIPDPNPSSRPLWLWLCCVVAVVVAVVVIAVVVVVVQACMLQ